MCGLQSTEILTNPVFINGFWVVKELVMTIQDLMEVPMEDLLEMVDLLGMVDLLEILDLVDIVVVLNQQIFG